MKPRLGLRVQSGSLTGRQISMEDGSILLGRAEDCALRFDARMDPGVSSYHATVQADPQGFYIADNQSTNGTFVNDNRVQSAWLNSGDIIRLGTRGPTILATISWLEEQAAAQQASFPPAQAVQYAASAAQPQPAPFQPPVAETPGSTVSLRQSLYNIRVYDPQKDKKEHHFGAIALGCLVAGFLSLIVMVIMIWAIGSFWGAVVGGLMAFIPAPFYLMIFLWMDRYDPEPPMLLSISFAWGALVAIFVSFIVNTLFGSVAAAVVGAPAGNTISAIISAPFIEELTKGLGVVLMMLLFRKEFDGVLDGIVYAGVVALGFATVENVLYYGRTFIQSGVSGLLVIGFLRGVLSPFCHSLFTSMTGIGCGLSRESYNKGARIAFPIIGWFGAMTLHGLWNLLASLSGGFFVAAYFIVWLPLFAIFLMVILRMAKRERDIIKRSLKFEVAAGLIGQEELEMAGSLTRRYGWLWDSLNDRVKLRARRHFLRAVTKLAFCYWHVENANKAGNQTISLPQIPKFRSEITALRPQI